MTSRALRATADGCVSILLPAYLIEIGFSAFEIGAIATATMLGSAALTIFAGKITGRFGHRRPLLAAAVLMLFTGLGFTSFQAFWPLLLIGFVGTLNPSAGDVSIFFPLEQSLLAHSVADRERTELFASYSVAGSLMVAVGTLLAALPDWAHNVFGITRISAMQALFLMYALIGLAAGTIYRGLIGGDVFPQSERIATLGPSREKVYRLMALFSLDSFGSGFLLQAILAVWLLKKYDLAITTTAAIFFWSNLLSAISYLAAPPIARRIGLVRTMVYTHLPANLCLVAAPFVQDLRVVIALLLVRGLLSQMDVPTRTSYVMAVVTAPERSAAAGLTAVPRALMSAISPLFAGFLLTSSTFGWPLIIGGSLKIGYDIFLLKMFRHVRPPEELPSISQGVG